MTEISKRIKWEVRKVDINLLKPYSKNPRIITDSGIEQLTNSFNDCGYAQFINVNTDFTILSGHARWQALLKEGAKEVEVLLPDRTLTPKQEEAIVVRMNKNTAGVWDWDVLANEFEIDDLSEWGFSDSELEYFKDKDDDDKDDDIDSDVDESYTFKITCPIDLKDEVLFFIKGKLLESSFEGVHIE